MPYDQDGDFFPSETTPKAVLTFTIEGYEPAALAEAVVAHIASDRRQQIDKLLNESIAARVADLVNAAIVDQIGEHVRKLLDEGFQPTNAYGVKQGERKTVGDMILDALKPNNNSYVSYGLKTLPAIISDTIRKDFDKEIKDATARLKATVDGAIGEQLNAALRAAVGIK